jgi:hypothetical protein
MKLIPSYQEFVYDMPLQGKISPELAEKLASDFEEIGAINEGFLDSIKNTLSKTFLGSLSHINMIDQSREILLKAKKELLTKRYAHEDEIESLNNNLKQAQGSDDEVNSSTIKKTILNKENEYKTYVKMINKGIEKSENTLVKVIDGNRRRKEYYEAGQSEDELQLAELEYKLAKERSESDPKKLKELEEDVKKRKEEAEEAKERLKKEEEEAKAKMEKGKGKEKEESVIPKGNLTPEGNKLLRNIQDMQDELDKLEVKISDLQHKKIDGTITQAGKMALAKNLELKKDYKTRLREAERKLTSNRKPEKRVNRTNFKGLTANVNRAASKK